MCGVDFVIFNLYLPKKALFSKEVHKTKHLSASKSHEKASFPHRVSAISRSTGLPYRIPNCAASPALYSYVKGRGKFPFRKPHSPFARDN